MPNIRRTHLHDELRRILLDRRLKANLSQVDLATRLDKPQSFVSKYEAGERRLDALELIEIAEAIGCKPERIITELRTARQRGPSDAPPLEKRPRRTRKPVEHEADGQPISLPPPGVYRAP